MGKDKIRTLHWGIGPVGLEILRLVIGRPDLEIAGAIDDNSVGKDVGLIAGLGKPLGIPVEASADRLLIQAGSRVVLHTAGVKPKDVYTHIAKALNAGLPVISTCQWLAYPEDNESISLAEDIDHLATYRGVAVLGVVAKGPGRSKGVAGAQSVLAMAEMVVKAIPKVLEVEPGLAAIGDESF